MILTLSWLKNHLNTKASINEIIEKLTNIGLEVEGIKEGAGNLSEFKIAKILKTEKHPNADKLFVITIDEGSGTTRTVCAGLKGHYEPSELEGLNVVFVANLEPRKLRGVVSEGMILAADNGQGGVKVLTTEGDILSGSRVR